MIFSRAFYTVLQPNAGIVVDMTVEIKSTMPPDFPKDVVKLLVCELPTHGIADGMGFMSHNSH